MVKITPGTRLFIEQQASFLRTVEEMGVLEELSDEYPEEVRLIREILFTDEDGNIDQG